MSIYVVMASTDKGASWQFCIDSTNNLLSDNMKSVAKIKMEEMYERMREDCRQWGVKHIPRKYFKIVEFVSKEVKE